MPSCWLVLATSDVVKRKLVLHSGAFNNCDVVFVREKNSCGKQTLYLMLHLLQCEVGIAILFQSVSELRRRMRSLLEELVHRCCCWCSFKCLFLHMRLVWSVILAARQKICSNLAITFSKFHTQAVAFQSVKCFSEIFSHGMHYLLKCRM